ncbi:MAG: VOC family protein, partial [Chloroflexota bacterium]
TGAAVGVWQPGTHIGAQLVNQPNTLVWNELQTRDVDGARSFYGPVFGWTYRAGDGGYVMVEQDGRIQAGMMPIDESWGANVPANWMVYFHVEDVDGMVAKAQGLGGGVIVPPMAAGEMGRFAVLRDPQGGVFTVMTFNGPTDTPPGELE